MTQINLLVAVTEGRAKVYYQNLSSVKDFNLQIATNFDDARQLLADRDHRIDLFVIDNNLLEQFDLIREIRHSYPRLIIILVDEEADFGLPGQADDISTDPFKDNDLVKRINALMSDRRMETLRSDSLPAVREVAKVLRSASGVVGKQQAAVDAAMELGYDYVAYYHREDGELRLKAHVGPNAIKAIAPKRAENDLITWVAEKSQTRIATYGDELNHPLVSKGRLGAVACVPVIFDSQLYGVLTACNDNPDAVVQDNVLMLELISAQLAAAIKKELTG